MCDAVIRTDVRMQHHSQVLYPKTLHVLLIVNHVIPPS